jgi:hypothetical protein
MTETSVTETNREIIRQAFDAWRQRSRVQPR